MGQHGPLGSTSKVVLALTSTDGPNQIGYVTTSRCLLYRIRNIPRPDITRKIFGRSLHDVAHSEERPGESVDLQRGTYAKLSRFTKLRDLRLGLPIGSGNRDPKLRNRDYLLQF